MPFSTGSQLVLIAILVAVAAAHAIRQQRHGWAVFFTAATLTCLAGGTAALIAGGPDAALADIPACALISALTAVTAWMSRDYLHRLDQVRALKRQHALMIRAVNGDQVAARMLAGDESLPEDVRAEMSALTASR
jgi:hypothetical protein